MKLKIQILLSAIFMASCLKTEEVLPAPVISFYKGIDAWTNQPTFVYTDTTINGIKGKIVNVHFAAAATLKDVLITMNGEEVHAKNFENGSYFNYNYLLKVIPQTLPYTCVLKYKAIDYHNNSAEKTLTINFK